MSLLYNADKFLVNIHDLPDHMKTILWFAFGNTTLHFPILQLWSPITCNLGLHLP